MRARRRAGGLGGAPGRAGQALPPGVRDRAGAHGALRARQPAAHRGPVPHRSRLRRADAGDRAEHAVPRGGDAPRRRGLRRPQGAQLLLAVQGDPAGAAAQGRPQLGRRGAVLREGAGGDAVERRGRLPHGHGALRAEDLRARRRALRAEPRRRLRLRPRVQPAGDLLPAPGGPAGVRRDQRGHAGAAQPGRGRPPPHRRGAVRRGGGGPGPRRRAAREGRSGAAPRQGPATWQELGPGGRRDARGAGQQRGRAPGASEDVALPRVAPVRRRRARPGGGGKSWENSAG
mmetsp:Transcript_78888/g.223234  ORF Transcript_78888/g.223234 Transcript_78888/m.223234 type:complete len:288 (-) Transcript_78888:10-873(-)